MQYPSLKTLFIPSKRALVPNVVFGALTGVLIFFMFQAIWPVALGFSFAWLGLNLLNHHFDEKAKNILSSANKEPLFTSTSYLEGLKAKQSYGKYLSSFFSLRHWTWKNSYYFAIGLRHTPQGLWWFAIEKGNIDLMKSCLELGVGVNDMKDGNTALTIAVAKNNFAMVNLLITAKADVNKPNSIEKGNQTPHQLATSKDSKEIMAALLQAGAKPITKEPDQKENPPPAKQPQNDEQPPTKKEATTADVRAMLNDPTQDINFILADAILHMRKDILTGLGELINKKESMKAFRKLIELKNFSGTKKQLATELEKNFDKIAMASIVNYMSSLLKPGQTLNEFVTEAAGKDPAIIRTLREFITDKKGRKFYTQLPAFKKNTENTEGDCSLVESIINTYGDILFNAALKNNVPVIRALLATRNDNGDVILEMLRSASKSGNSQKNIEAALKVLVREGADLNSSETMDYHTGFKIGLASPQASGATLLQAFANEGNVLVVRALINVGAKVDARGIVHYKKRTPLLFAVENAHLEVVKELVKKTNLQQPLYKTIVRDAILPMGMGNNDQASEEIIKILLAANANPNAQERGDTAIDLAFRMKLDTVVKALQERGAKVSKKEEQRSKAQPQPVLNAYKNIMENQGSATMDTSLSQAISADTSLSQPGLF